MQRNVAKAIIAAPVDHDFEKPVCHSLAARQGLRVHVENPRALGQRFAGVTGPAGQHEATASDNRAVGGFREPTSVSSVLESLGEILPGSLIYTVERCGIAKPH